MTAKQPAPLPLEPEPINATPFAQNGEEFGDLYLREFSGLCGLAFALTHDREVARDITQDAFVRLHPRFASVRNPVAYLRRSIVNGSHSHFRRLARTRKHAPSPPESSELHARELSDALCQLTPRQRDAITLRYYLDLPDADIAEALGVRVGTVPSLIHRGLAELKRTLPL